MNFKCRIARSYADISGCVEKIATLCDKIAVYEHNEMVERTHIHFVAINAKDIETFKYHIKKHIILKGNKDWSFSAVWQDGDVVKDVDEGFVSYMSKGIYDPMYYKGFTQEEIHDYKSKGYTSKGNNKKEITKRVELQDGKLVVVGEDTPKVVKQLTKWRIIGLVRDKFKSEVCPDPLSVWKAIRNVCLEREQALGEYKQQELVEQFYYRFFKASSAEAFMKLWNRRHPDGI